MFRPLGIAAGIASLSILAWKGFEFSFGPFLMALLEFYEKQTGSFFALLEPIISAQLAYLRVLAGWELTLYPHWKHTFILLWLYFGACARAYWKTGTKGGAVFVALWGGLVALVSGALSGTVALEEGTQRSMLMAFWPVAGVILFECGYNAWVATFDRGIGETWVADFLALTGFTVSRIALPGLLALIVGTQFAAIPNPGLTLLFVLTIALAVLWIWQGVSTTGARDGDVRSRGFLSDANSRIGIDMLAVIGGATFVVLLGMVGV